MTNLRETLQAIHAEYGRLDPVLCVKLAEKEDHPLHDHFEWDDTKAGHAYRIEQARQLIKSVKINIIPATPGAEPRRLRAFHAIPETVQNAPHRYEPNATVVADPVMSAVLLASMQREWKALYRRYRAFEEFKVMVLADLSVAVKEEE